MNMQRMLINNIDTICRHDAHYGTEPQTPMTTDRLASPLPAHRSPQPAHFA